MEPNKNNLGLRSELFVSVRLNNNVCIHHFDSYGQLFNNGIEFKNITFLFEGQEEQFWKTFHEEMINWLNLLVDGKIEMDEVIFNVMHGLLRDYEENKWIKYN